MELHTLRLGDAFLVLLGVATLSLPALAAVAEGENLLINGGFDAEQVAFPEFWTPSSSTKGVIYLRTGEPEGRKPAIVLQGEKVRTGEVSVRQQGLTLVAGETYKLSAYIKTKGFQSRNAGLIIHNVVGKKFNPRRFGIAAELAGAEVLPERSFVHVDRRNGGHDGPNNNVGKINLHRIIFRANSPTQVVAFHDADASPGEELIFNFVQLKPYLE